MRVHGKSRGATDADPLYVCARMCVCVCVRACTRACVRAYVCVCASSCLGNLFA